MIMKKNWFMSIESTLKLPKVRGTVKEMQLRFMLHEIRKAADEGKSQTTIYEYKLQALHIPTLRNEILKLAGFQSNEFVEDGSEMKMLCISWH